MLTFLLYCANVNRRKMLHRAEESVPANKPSMPISLFVFELLFAGLFIAKNKNKNTPPGRPIIR